MPWRRRFAPRSVNPAPRPAIRNGRRSHVGVQRRGPVVEHAPAFADARIIPEEALDVVLDRPLAPEHRRRHFEVVTAITGNQRQVAAADPDDRANRIADREDRQPRRPCRLSQPPPARPSDQQDRSDREMPADEDELRRPADPRQERDLVELMGDGVEGRGDPAVPSIEPGAERRRDRRARPREASARRSRHHPWRSSRSITRTRWRIRSASRRFMVWSP